jgi:hypothetical protein
MGEGDAFKNAAYQMLSAVAGCHSDKTPPGVWMDIGGHEEGQEEGEKLTGRDLLHPFVRQCMNAAALLPGLFRRFRQKLPDKPLQIPRRKDSGNVRTG